MFTISEGRLNCGGEDFYGYNPEILKKVFASLLQVMRMTYCTSAEFHVEGETDDDIEILNIRMNEDVVHFDMEVSDFSVSYNRTDPEFISALVYSC